jgi:hypothetical protein
MPMMGRLRFSQKLMMMRKKRMRIKKKIKRLN